MPLFLVTDAEVLGGEGLPCLEFTLWRQSEKLLLCWNSSQDLGGICCLDSWVVQKGFLVGTKLTEAECGISYLWCGASLVWTGSSINSS